MDSPNGLALIWWTAFGWRMGHVLVELGFKVHRGFEAGRAEARVAKTRRWIRPRLRLLQKLSIRALPQQLARPQQIGCDGQTHVRCLGNQKLEWTNR
ncbi:MAG TPA: hypothetical protein VGI63_09035 [Verrucomicrobiae bacterium]